MHPIGLLCVKIVYFVGMNLVRGYSYPLNLFLWFSVCLAVQQVYLPRVLEYGEPTKGDFVMITTKSEIANYIVDKEGVFEDGTFCENYADR